MNHEGENKEVSYMVLTGRWSLNSVHFRYITERTNTRIRGRFTNLYIILKS